MKLTKEEAEFLRKYRELDEYDRGRIAQRLEDLAENPSRLRGWEVCKDGEEERRKNDP